MYWARDPRYSGSLLVVPLLPVLLSSRRPTAGEAVLLVVAPVAALLIGWSISADVAYDSTAFALHVASAVSGLADRAGRALAAAVIAVPVVLRVRGRVRVVDGPLGRPAGAPRREPRDRC